MAKGNINTDKENKVRIKFKKLEEFTLLSKYKPHQLLKELRAQAEFKPIGTATSRKKEIKQGIFQHQ